MVVVPASAAASDSRQTPLPDVVARSDVRVLQPSSGSVEPAVRQRAISEGHQHRPAALVPLYAAFASLQLLDAHSTLAATRGGAAEGNPLVKPFVGTPGALLGVKASTTVLTIIASEKLWRRNRASAVATMLAVNIAYTAVVWRNYGK
jgi:hypothetical protein